MPVNARRYIRKLRGGAQAHLLEADDDRFYVVKFRNNPQHRRVLINEWIGGSILKHLGIACPDIQLVRLDATFIRANPEVYIQLGGQRVAVEIGWHFGSCYPGNPNTVAVYDFIPDALLDQIANLEEFSAALVFDKWTGNADARQSVFLRARLRDYVTTSTAHPLRIGFVALMVDQGYIFNGPHWEYVDSPIAGLYYRLRVYSRVRGLDDFRPWLDRVLAFPEEEIDRALRSIPPEWFDGDEPALHALLEKLMVRRARVPDLLAECSRAQNNPFPQWRRS